MITSIFYIQITVIFLIFSCDFKDPSQNTIHDLSEPQLLTDFMTYGISYEYAIIDHSPYINVSRDFNLMEIEMTENISRNSISTHKLIFKSNQSVEIANFTHLNFNFDYLFDVTNSAHKSIFIKNFQLRYQVLGESSYSFISPNSLDELLTIGLPIKFMIILELSSGDTRVINNPMNTATMRIQKFNISGVY